MSQQRIIIGLSGGVDSAVAALRLRRAGYRVEGLFMKNWEDDDTLLHCAAEADLSSARSVADHLGIPLHCVNFAAAYRREVFDPALADLQTGRTPNPDILCNRQIKFGHFLRHAIDQLGADAVATGHYARLVGTEDGSPALLRGSDPHKDQSYFLAGVARPTLRHVRFPLGDARKDAVRAEAREAGLPNFDRPDSTGICFIGERDFASFMQHYIAPSPGPILREDGVKIGCHEGLAFYTLGQRRGLGIGGGAGREQLPWYVAAKEGQRNALIVVQGHDHPWLHSSAVATGPFNWLGPPPEEGTRLLAQIRYRQRPQPGQLAFREDGTPALTFDHPQRAATPGQHLVLYDGDRCLGGGAIDTTYPSDRTAPQAQMSLPTPPMEAV